MTGAPWSQEGCTVARKVCWFGRDFQGYFHGIIGFETRVASPAVLVCWMQTVAACGCRVQARLDIPRPLSTQGGGALQYRRSRRESYRTNRSLHHLSRVETTQCADEINCRIQYLSEIQRCNVPGGLTPESPFADLERLSHRHVVSRPDSN
jgi:hypothetical protein